MFEDLESKTMSAFDTNQDVQATRNSDLNPTWLAEPSLVPAGVAVACCNYCTFSHVTLWTVTFNWTRDTILLPSQVVNPKKHLLVKRYVLT
jgi:hypothetical protein